jgi:hypothetical protein
VLKSITFSLMAVLFGATAAAQAAYNGSCCTEAATCCTSGAPAPPADEHSNMNMPTARAPQGTRSFSYQPSTGYAPARGTSRQGWNSGVRGAASKALGNY